MGVSPARGTPAALLVAAWLGVGAGAALTLVGAASTVAARPGGAAALGADFVAGSLVAAGAGAPDMAAPSPAVARVAAERLAQRNARRALLRLALGLRASGKDSVAERLGCSAGAPPCKDGAALTRLEAALAAEAVFEASEYFSDGAVRLRARVALEVVRGALDPREAADVPVLDDAAPTALIVDAAGLGGEFGVAPTLRAGATSWTGPVLYAASAKAAAAEVRAGVRTAKLKARAAAGADLTLADAAAEALKQARKTGALVIIVAVKAAGK